MYSFSLTFVYLYSDNNVVELKNYAMNGDGSNGTTVNDQKKKMMSETA